MSAKDPNVLEGWTEITEHLNALGIVVGERTVRRYVRRRDALPVYKRLGRIVAHRQAIKEWVSRQTTHASARAT